MSDLIGRKGRKQRLIRLTSMCLGGAGLTVLALAAVLRLVGLDHGMPFWIVNDELPLIGGALRMLELRNPIPSLNPGPMSILYYPPGLPWLYLVVWGPVLAIQWAASGFSNLVIFADQILADLLPIWIVSRLVSVALSVATVWVVMRLANEVFRDRVAGVVAGLLMATSFHHVLLGHFARVWPATVFLFWCGLWAAWRIYVDGRRRDYAWAALAAGLGFGVNYVGVLVSVAVAIAHLARYRRLVIDRALLLHAAIVAVCIVVFMIASWQNFHRLMGYSDIFVQGGPQTETIGGGRGELAWYYLDVVLKSDPVLLGVGLAGLIIVAVRRPTLAAISVALWIPYGFVILSGRGFDDRYVLPITPLFAITGAALIAIIWKRSRSIGMIASLAVLAFPLAASVQLDWLLCRPDTREVARDLLLSKAQSGGIISAMKAVPLEQNIESLRMQRDIDPDSLSYLDRRRLAKGIDANGIKALNLLQVSPERLAPRGADVLYADLKERGYVLYVTDDFVSDSARKPLDEVVRRRGTRLVILAPTGTRSAGPIPNLTDQFERGGAFDVFNLGRLGPVVEIWRLD